MEEKRRQRKEGIKGEKGEVKEGMIGGAENKRVSEENIGRGVNESRRPYGAVGDGKRRRRRWRWGR